MSPRVSESHKKRRRQQVLDAAAACFARAGYAGTTMKDILAESGLSAGAVYNYFASKEALYAALLDQNVEDLVAAIRLEADASASSWKQLRTVIHRHFGSFRSDRQEEATRIYLLDFLPASVHNAELRGRLQRRNALMHELIAELLSQGIAKGEFRDVDPKATAALILAAGDGVRLHALTTGTLDDAERMFEVFTGHLKATLIKPQTSA